MQLLACMASWLIIMWLSCKLQCNCPVRKLTGREASLTGGMSAWGWRANYFENQAFHAALPWIYNYIMLVLAYKRPCPLCKNVEMRLWIVAESMNFLTHLDSWQDESTHVWLQRKAVDSTLTRLILKIFGVDSTHDSPESRPFESKIDSPTLSRAQPWSCVFKFVVWFHHWACSAVSKYTVLRHIVTILPCLYESTVRPFA